MNKVKLFTSLLLICLGVACFVIFRRFDLGKFDDGAFILSLVFSAWGLLKTFEALGIDLLRGYHDPWSGQNNNASDSNDGDSD